MIAAHQLDKPYLDVPSAKALPLAVAPAPTGPALPPIPLRNPDQALILDCVCHSYVVSRDALCGTDRHRNVSEARVVTYWLLRTLTRASSPEIGQLLGRDNSTILMGVRSAEKRRATDAAFRSFMDELAMAVKARLQATPTATKETGEH